MLININFTLDVKDPVKLCQFTGSGDNYTASSWVKGEAQELLVEYLKDNGIELSIKRDSLTN